MKKITLMLCACAMAFAGLLVSCSNGAEKWIDGTKHGSSYSYAISGTVTESMEEGTTGATTVYKYVYTLSKGTGSIWLNKEDTRKENNDNASTAGIWFNGIGDRVVTVGTADPEKTYNETYNSNHNSGSTTLYKLDGVWYISHEAYDSTYGTSGGTVTTTPVKLETVPEFDGSDYNLKVTMVKDDSDSDAGTVEKRTISYDISFKAVDAE